MSLRQTRAKAPSQKPGPSLRDRHGSRKTEAQRPNVTIHEVSDLLAAALPRFQYLLNPSTIDGKTLAVLVVGIFFLSAALN